MFRTAFSFRIDLLRFSARSEDDALSCMNEILGFNPNPRNDVLSPIRKPRDDIGIALSLNPRRQEGANISASRNRGQIVELVEQLSSGQTLDDPQAERRASNSAARQGESG